MNQYYLRNGNEQFRLGFTIQVRKRESTGILNCDKRYTHIPLKKLYGRHLYQL
jgi:hypothetical protein